MGFSTDFNLTLRDGGGTNGAMLQELVQKAIELLEKSEHLSFLLPNQADLDCLVAAEVLSTVLTGQDKNINFLSRPITNQLSTPNLFPKTTSSSLPPREFVAVLDTTFSPVSQLRYEKLDNKIEVVFSPKSSSIKKDFISFKEGKMMVDAIIALGVSDSESTDTEGLDPDIFTSVPIINFDYSEKNKNYGEVNLIDTGRISLSEMVYDFMSVYQEQPMSRNLATLLLGGILHKSGGFRLPVTNADTLLVASELLRLGADKETAFRLTQSASPLALTQLWGRASIRSRSDEDKKIIWSYLTSEDFEKTGRDSNDTPFIAHRLVSALPFNYSLVLLWQDFREKTIRILLAGDRAETLGRKTEAERYEGYTTLSNQFATFKEAEDFLIPLLEEQA